MITPVSAEQKRDLLRSFMLQVAPTCTRYTLDTLRLFRQREYATQDDTCQSDRDEASELASALTLEIAARLVFKFSTYDTSHSPQKTDPLRSRSRLRRVSKVRNTQLREYARMRLSFLRAHLHCQICGGISSEVHHKHGRIGQRLMDFEHCLAVCFPCHRYLHDNPRWAREQGYLL